MSSQESYNEIWKNSICPYIYHYLEHLNQRISLREDINTLRETIWEKYKMFNEQCREYMSGDVEKLDRHKVTSCYIYAILDSEPFEYTIDAEDGKINIAIEQMAISIGLYVLKSFLISKYDRNDNLKKRTQLRNDISIFSKGFVFPNEPLVEHGDYRNNFAVELYFTRKEKRYNILSLSHTLYLLEVFNRMNWKDNQHNKQL